VHKCLKEHRKEVAWSICIHNNIYVWCTYNLAWTHSIPRTSPQGTKVETDGKSAFKGSHSNQACLFYFCTRGCAWPCHTRRVGRNRIYTPYIRWNPCMKTVHLTVYIRFQPTLLTSSMAKSYTVSIYGMRRVGHIQCLYPVCNTRRVGHIQCLYTVCVARRVGHIPCLYTVCNTRRVGHIQCLYTVCVGLVIYRVYIRYALHVGLVIYSVYIRYAIHVGLVIYIVYIRYA